MNKYGELIEIHRFMADAGTIMTKLLTSASSSFCVADFLCFRTKSGNLVQKDVQELLGHSDVSTTMNVHDEIIAYATKEAKRDSAKLLDKVVGMN